MIEMPAGSGRRARLVRSLVTIVLVTVSLYSGYWHYQIWRTRSEPNAPTTYSMGGYNTSRLHDCVNSLHTYILLIRAGKNPYTLTDEEFQNATVSPEPLQRDLVPNNPPPHLVLNELFGVEASTEAFNEYRQRWFVFELIVCVAALLWVAVAMSESSPSFVWLVPFTFASTTWLQNLHFGQNHLLTVALGLAAACALAHRRDRIGGLLLGFITMAHILPGIFFIPLVIRRRWEAVGWAIGIMTVLTLISLAVLGLEINLYYLTKVLPEAALSGGTKSSSWITKISFVSIFGKLLVSGVPLPVVAVSALGKLFTLSVVGAAVLFGMRRQRAPIDDFCAYMSLLCLALATNADWRQYGLIAPFLLALVLAARALDAPARQWRGALFALASMAFIGLVPYWWMIDQGEEMESMLVPTCVYSIVILALSIWGIRPLDVREAAERIRSRLRRVTPAARSR